jgi:threonine synthase
VLETAQPAKFEDTIVEALGRKPARPAGLENIEALPQRVEVMDVDAAGHQGAHRQDSRRRLMPERTFP